MEIDFEKVEEATEQDFSPIPKGTYLFKITNVDTSKQTKNGDEMWHVEFECQEPDQAGRKIWDNLVFSEKALSRVKFICKRLGIDVSKKINLQPEILKERLVYIDVDIQDYMDFNGNKKQRNAITFTGYHSVEEIEGVEGKVESTEETVPF